MNCAFAKHPYRVSWAKEVLFFQEFILVADFKGVTLFR